MDDFQVFISYRREGGADFAGRLNDRLVNMGYRVFFDVDSMHAGKFDEQLLCAIEGCRDVLLILPPNSLDRCTDENDFVRKEIEHAIKHNKNIIPVMIGGFKFPEVLPESVDSVRFYEGVSVYGEYFDAAVDKICSLMQAKVEKNTPTQSDSFAAGMKFLEMKLYDKALDFFEKEIAEDVSNSQAYFYASVCMLKGKRPFLAIKSVIGKIEEYMAVAIAMEECALYHCFMAYIKFDYYKNKCLKTVPDYAAEYQTAKGLGLQFSDVQSLFALLKTEMPDFM